MKGLQALGCVCACHCTFSLCSVHCTTFSAPCRDVAEGLVHTCLIILNTRSPELWTAAPHSPPPAKAFLIPSRKQCGHPEESDSFYLWVSILCNFPIQLSEEQPSELAPAKVIYPCLLVEFFFPASKGRKEIGWPSSMAILSGKAFVQGWVGSAKTMKAAIFLGLLTSPFPPIPVWLFHS